MHNSPPEEAEDATTEASETATENFGVPVRRRSVGARLAVTVLALVIAMMAAFGIDSAMHGGKIARGVVVGGLPLGGLTKVAAQSALAKRQAELDKEPMKFVVAAENFELGAEEIGLALDVDKLSEAAMKVGRAGGLFGNFASWLRRFVAPEEVPLAVAVDDKELAKVLDSWAKKAIADPPFEGGVVVEGESAKVLGPKAGREIDRVATRDLIHGVYLNLERDPKIVEVVTREPKTRPEQWAAAITSTDALMSGPIVLEATLPKRALKKKERRRRGRKNGDDTDADSDAKTTISQRFEPKVLATALRSELQQDVGRVWLDGPTLELSYADVKKKLEQPAIDASFDIDSEDKITIKAGKPGTRIDPEIVSKALFEAAKLKERKGALPIEEGAPPRFSAKEAEALKITGLVSEFTTRHPCCRNRVKNIHQISDMLDRTIVRPGDVFSINEKIGPRTRSKGFYPAPTIVDGEMKDTIGGGISQFATTMFNAAFYGGYDIIERQAHSYYFRRYPMGVEATLSFPKPDLIFRNDSKAGLLIRAIYTPTSITIKFYGDNGGRKVKKWVSRPHTHVKPPKEYEADDRLRPGKKKTVQGGKSGWTVTVKRTVDFADGTTQKHVRRVTYKPQKRILRVHSCKIPHGFDGWTGSKCPKVEDDDDDDDDDGDDEGGSSEPPPGEDGE